MQQGLNDLIATRETQPRLRNIVNGLLSNARWNRTQPYDPECTLVNSERRIHVSLARCEKDVAEAHRLFCQALKPPEVEALERLTSNWRGEKISGKMTQYRVFIARTKYGEPVAAHAGHVITLGDKSSNESAFIGSYAATANNFRGMGLMSEMFTCSLMQAARDAHDRRQVLRLIAGDCSESSEKVWNKAGGRKRVYMRIGRNFQQVRFMQPSLRFDFSTGEPAKDAGAVEQNLMIRDILGNGEISPELLRKTVAAIYRWCAKRPKEQFVSIEAYARYREHFSILLREFGEQFNGEKLCLLSQAERKAKEEQGVVFL